jgi:hypothetical protein
MPANRPSVPPMAPPATAPVVPPSGALVCFSVANSRVLTSCESSTEMSDAEKPAATSASTPFSAGRAGLVDTEDRCAFASHNEVLCF